MTIIIVNDFGYVNGGSSQVAIENAVMLKQLGHHVIFFTAVEPIDERIQQSEIQVVCTHQDECLKYSNKAIGAITGLWNVKAYKMLSSILKRLDPSSTVVHVHGWTKALSSSVFAAIAKNNFKMIITAHDYFLACPNGGFYNYQKQEICPYQALGGKCICTHCDKRSYTQKLYRVLRQMIQNRMIAKNQVNLIFVSHFSENILQRQIPYEYRGKVVFNPIKLIPKIEDENSRSRDCYIFLGRLSPEKGADLFCEAIYRLRLKGILIGDGESRTELERHYKNYDQLQFTGWLSHNEMGAYLQQGKALIVPSRLYETAVLTIPEVQANYDIPVIVGDQCAGKEFVKKGIVYRSNNLNSLITAIKAGENNLWMQYSNESGFAKYNKRLEDFYYEILRKR